MVKGTRNLFFSDFLVQLQRAATLYGYNGIISYIDENANEIDAADAVFPAEAVEPAHDLKRRLGPPGGLARPADADAVAAHRATPHFQNYLSQIGDLAERAALVLNPVSAT